MMSKFGKREYLIEVKRKYWKASKKRKGQLLDDFCDFTGIHRKSALRLINGRMQPKWRHRKKREKHYDQPVIDALVLLWRATDEICAERLHPFIPEILQRLVDCQEIVVNDEVRDKLLKISLGLVKEILSKTKHRSVVRIGGTTKPGSILKRQIAIRYGRWDETAPGWCETDTVAHCGESAAGEYISSLNVIDISSGWSEQSAIKNKGERAVTSAMDGIKKRLPFILLGLDPDNGAEFINWSLTTIARRTR